MAKLVPMLAAIAQASTPADKKSRPKPRSEGVHGHKKGHRVTHGEKSMVQPHQQHGELATAAAPTPLSERMQMKEHARHEKRMATERWISGHMSSEEHEHVHRRADHILSGKHPRHYSGKTGERKIKGL